MIFCKKILILSLVLTIVSCSSYSPILDPHGKYLEVGEAGAEEDVAECTNEAEEYLSKFKAERAAREAGRRSVVGGVVGAGSGLLFGRTMKSTLIGTAIGAGVGAAIGGLSVLGEDKVTPDKMKQRYIGKCLAVRGYSIIGWK